MIVIQTNKNFTFFETQDMDIQIEGDFELRKEGDKPLTIYVNTTNDNKH